MIRLLAIILLAFGIHFHCTNASELDPLLQTTGKEFTSRLDLIVTNPKALAEIHGTHNAPANAQDLRRDLLRRLVLSRESTPEVFQAFNQMISLVRPDSPLVSGRWWYDVENRSMRPDELLTYMVMRHWLQRPVFKREEWISLFMPVEVIPVLSAPDEKRQWNQIWPAIAFGLSGEPANLRKKMSGAFALWCSEESYSETSLEGFLWFCERTDYNKETVITYGAMIGLCGLIPGRESAALSRDLAYFDAGEHFITSKEPLDAARIFDLAKQHGTPEHAATLRRIAEIPTWDVYREQMLQAAEQIEQRSKQPTPK